MKISKKDFYFIIKASLFYGMISIIFSFSSVFLADKTTLVNPLHGTFDIKEIPGHFLWGFAAASVTWRLKYALLGGVFAVFVDFDHVISILQMQGISHMSHSIAFAGISLVIMMITFGRKDYILGAVALSSVLTHISYDLFWSSNKFPLFAPVYDTPVYFVSGYSMLFEIAAIIIIGATALIVRKKNSDAKSVKVK